MSKKKGKRAQRRSREGPMPFAGAGLIRFFQEESKGIKLGPYVTLAVSLILLIAVIVSLALFSTGA
ncbi:MAG: preprotein translocase subunit Sec61beta [Candidatus Helarchaeota archaeon]